VVAEITDRMRDELARAGCKLSVTLEPAEGRWDRARLDQVVTNLFSNAMKYGKDHPIDVRVEARTDAAVLIVRDHGIGISDEDQTRIFERFERAVSSRHFGGLGLGLWIVHQLVAAHGGTISVRSKVGQGAEFVVTLPRPAPSG
jgi:signal transduction histidine kinase